MFWPGINKDIDIMISKCETCQKHKNRPSKEPMLIPELPVASWEKVEMNLFQKEKTTVCSDFPEMALLSNTSVNGVNHTCESILRHTMAYHFKSTVSTIKWKSEKGVHVLKQFLEKAFDRNSDPYLALQCGVSPAELLMNRKLRTTRPCYTQRQWDSKL